MCGITGAFAFTKQGSERLERTNDANAVLEKRGPDGGASFRNTHSALGHRRLSIIDVSCAGDQPMTTPDGRFTIAFNGEIFNYEELKAHLTEEERAALRSTSDTEVFLFLYARMGPSVFPLLRGFFAAAITDNERNTMAIVRDRYGKKPLLYYKDENAICFASEMKALFAYGIPRVVDWNILPIYLQLNYVPQPYSLVKGVQKLMPGHYMFISPDGIETRSYYQLQTYPERYADLSYEAAQQRLHEMMDESVRLRMISDVPLGAFLSGGIDSSVVVALAARHTDKLNTFSIGYKDNAFFDETRYAKLVAERYKTEHTVFSLSTNDFLEHVHDVLDYIDEPFADSSAIPVFILSQYTRKHVTVALSGDGGDEVFAGYNKHAAEWRIRQKSLVNKAVEWAHPLLSLLPKSRNNPLTNKFRQLHRFAGGAKLSPADRYWKWATFQNETEAMDLLSPAVKSQVQKEMIAGIPKEYTHKIASDDFNEVLLADMDLVLLSDMLTKVDLMSMANSLEVRSPFLDQDVVEFAFGLPAAYKIDGKMKKRIVQDAFRKDLPEEIYNRPKHGFEIPLLDWFRNELSGLINDDLLKESFVEEQGIFNVAAIRQLKKQLNSANPGDSHATIWALIVFQHWWKRYMAGS